ncbi:hypothetical protein ACP275_04G039900 [Erythranthe tilingii]
MMTSSSSSSDQEEEKEEEELAGVGRSYECVFCKRGFNTAQALGGHMNIHRKHRPSSSSKTCTTNNNHYNYKPSTATSSNQRERQMLYNAGPRLYQQINVSPSSANHFVASHHHHHHQQPSFYNNEYRQPSDRSIVVPADNWRLRLSLEFSPMNIVEEDKNKQEVMNQKEEEQLDLELRLGYI